MRHVRMWHWLFLLLVVLVLGFVEAEHAGTRAASLIQSAEAQAGSPVLLNETPESSSGWRMVGQVGGPTQALAVQGNYAYVGVGLRLVVLDVSNPITPTEAGSTTPFPYFVEDVVVSGTLAYVAAGGAGLRMVSILTPTAPVEIGAWDSPGYAEGVAVSGNTVYLADGPYGLWTVDVSNPSQPRKLGSAYDMNYAFEVAVSGHYAYIAAAGAGLLTADVTNPAHPLEIGALNTPGYAYGVAINGTLAYIADAWEGLQVINVSDPAHPVEVSACDTPGWAFGVAVVGTRAYVSDAFAGLQILDVSDINHPKELGGFSLWRGHAGSVAVSGNIAYVADRTWGLRVMDVSDPTHLSELGAYSPMGYAQAVAVEGNYAYVAAGGNGLRIVDVSDAGHPREIGGLGIPDPSERGASVVAVKGGYAYVGIQSSLYVADVSDPTRPHWTEKTDQIGNPMDMTVVGNIAYVANEDGLQVIDLSDPAHPALLGSIVLTTGEGAVCGVAVSGTLAYVTAETDGFHIVDVSDPNNPTLVGSAAIPSIDVDVASGWAYVVNRLGLSVVDVSDPAQPQIVSYAETEGDAYRVTVSGTTAYVADGARGLSVMDVSDSFHPALVANFNTPGYSLQVTLANDRLFIPDGPNGLVVFQSSPVGDTIPAIEKEPADAQLLPSRFPLIESYGRSSWNLVERHGEWNIPYPDINSPKQQPIGGIIRMGIAITTTIVVTSSLDSGPGTLRQALLNARTGDRLIFDPSAFPPTNPVTITLESDLPLITQGNLTIDGSGAGVILDGVNIPVSTDFWPYGWLQGGLRLCSDGNTVMGLQLVRFPGQGVEIGGNGNMIGGDRSRGSGPLGQGNLISGNGFNGIYIDASQNNIVVGNLLGTDLTGTQAFGNGWNGVDIAGAGAGNRIGGTEPRDRNIISDNGQGVQIYNSSGNFVIGNYVGTDISGTAKLGNRFYGISMEVGSFNNVIQGNLVSGNRIFGIVINDWGSNYNIVIGNLIGTDASGSEAVPNNGCGVIVGFGVAFNRIGGSEPGEANLISGNNGCGLAFGGAVGHGNMVIGNLVGTTINGNAALGNATGANCAGIFVATSDAGTIVEGNLVSGNHEHGIPVMGDYNFVIGNHIGTDGDLIGPVPNTAAGIYVRGEHNVFQDNLAAYSLAGPGVEIDRWPYNTIRRNAIYGNAGKGIVLTNGGNEMIPVPIITTVTSTGVSGTACPGCTVEVFSDAEDEGRVYEGSAIADTSRVFTFTKASNLIGPYVTATATDRDGNTSEFSIPQKAWARICLPVILKSKM